MHSVRATVGFPLRDLLTDARAKGAERLELVRRALVVRLVRRACSGVEEASQRCTDDARVGPGGPLCRR